jgi:hypothetical protein
METSNDSASLLTQSIDADSDIVMVPWEQQENPTTEFPDDEYATAAADPSSSRRGTLTSLVVEDKETGDTVHNENHWLSHSYPSVFSQYYNKFGYRRAGNTARTMLPKSSVTTDGMGDDDPTGSRQLVSGKEGREEGLPMPSEDDMNMILEAAFPATDEEIWAPVSEVQVLAPGPEEEIQDDMSTLATSETSIVPSNVVHRDDEDEYQKQPTNAGVSPTTTLSLKLEDVVSTTLSEKFWKVVESDTDDSKEGGHSTSHGEQNSGMPSNNGKRDQNSLSSRKTTTLSGLSRANAMANSDQTLSNDIDKDEASGMTMQQPTSDRYEEETLEQECQVRPRGHSPETASSPKPPRGEQAWDSNAFFAVGETLLQSTTSTVLQAENCSNAESVTEPVGRDTTAKRWWLHRKSFLYVFSFAIALAAFFNGRGMDEAGIKSGTPSALKPASELFDMEDTQVLQCANDTGAVMTLPELAQVVWEVTGDIVSVENVIVPIVSTPDSDQTPVEPLETFTSSGYYESFPSMSAGTDKDHGSRKNGSLSISTFYGTAAIAYFAVFACLYRCYWCEHLTDTAARSTRPKVENEGVKKEPHLDGDTLSRNYDTMSRDALKEIARARGLHVRGLKRELIGRIVADYHRELDALSYRQLQRRCDDNNVTKTGTKEELIRRLLEKGL